MDTTLAALQALAWRGSAGQIRPVRLELACRPRDQTLLREHFRCPITFGAAQEAMVFARATLDVPFVSADHGAFGHVLQGLEQRLADGEGLAGLVGALRLAIARQLSEGRPPSVAAVSRRLGLSSRTLQRRLDAAGTSFQQQLAGVRRTTAGRLLAQTDLDPVAIALLLGFAEPNSFTRAFRTWERTTPLRWRQRHSVAQSQQA